jgi:Group II intron, maturase-specific domain
MRPGTNKQSVDLSVSSLGDCRSERNVPSATGPEFSGVGSTSELTSLQGPNVRLVQTICKLPEEKFDFLGYTFGRCYSPKTGRAYIGTVPSKKRVIRVCEAISETTRRERTLLDQEIVIAKLNRTMIGWANYFCL